MIIETIEVETDTSVKALEDLAGKHYGRIRINIVGDVAQVIVEPKD